MSPALRRYIALEGLIGALINAVLSAVFMFVIFGRQSMIAPRDLIVDSVPQSFMVSLMSAIVPALMTRRRMAAGIVPGLPPLGLPRAHPVVRGLVLAVAVAALAWLAHRAMLASAVGPWRFGAVLAGKVAYGTLIGAAVSMLAVCVALSDPVPPTRTI